jgi:hypothetical protein
MYGGKKIKYNEQRNSVQGNLGEMMGVAKQEILPFVRQLRG